MAKISKFETELYPLITSYSSTIIDVLNNLKDLKLRILPEFHYAILELDTRIKDIQVFVETGDYTYIYLHYVIIYNLIRNVIIKSVKSGELKAAEQTLERLLQMHVKLNVTAKNYEILLDSLIFFFNYLEEVR